MGQHTDRRINLRRRPFPLGIDVQIVERPPNSNPKSAHYTTNSFGGRLNCKNERLVECGAGHTGLLTCYSEQDNSDLLERCGAPHDSESSRFQVVSVIFTTPFVTFFGLL